uniref:NADH-ubiquinone oxidoreductase chain 2 n=2 Tax=Athalia sikkimensis TaxID=2950357 RepID=A0A977XSV1_9HYME|nr:NADH dehydrogenase subunit 2 [Athalia sikkimensis]UXW93386.1 NADH dehydrogenase subunit 2 [Athalia sikkimensis]
MNLILLNNKNFKNMNMNFILYMMLFFSTILVMNSSSWFSAWMGLEINMMSFIPLMMNNKNYLKSSNSMMMYFIVQVISSSILIMMMLNLKIIKMSFNSNLTMSIMLMSLIMKMGAAPFHWWIPKIMNNLNWLNCLILMTWQKIAPMILMIQLPNKSMIYMSAILSSFSGSMMAMNQTSFKIMLSFSSINHLGWMMMTMMLNFKMMYVYFLFYTSINMIICLNLNKFNINYLSQMFKINNNNKMIKLIINSSFLSLGGIPPFLGFLPKLMVLTLMIKNKMFIETFLMMILTLMILSIYMNSFTSSLLLNKMNIKWMNKIYKNLNSNKFNMYTLNLTMMLMISMWFLKKMI